MDASGVTDRTTTGSALIDKEALRHKYAEDGTSVCAPTATRSTSG